MNSPPLKLDFFGLGYIVLKGTPSKGPPPLHKSVEKGIDFKSIALITGLALLTIKVFSSLPKDREIPEFVGGALPDDPFTVISSLTDQTSSKESQTSDQVKPKVSFLDDTFSLISSAPEEKKKSEGAFQLSVRKQETQDEFEFLEEDERRSLAPTNSPTTPPLSNTSICGEVVYFNYPSSSSHTS